MACPDCGGRLTRWGYARARTLRGLGAATVVVRPPRVRCATCARTHVLLPTALQPRRADTTEVRVTALIDKAHGLGFRRIAARDGPRRIHRAPLAASRLVTPTCTGPTSTAPPG